MLSGYMGKSGVLDDALASFAMLQAEQNQSDYERFAARHDARIVGPH
jgi:hypothetical protein